MSTVPNITLNDGVQIPQLGFGVFQIDPDDTKDATLTALRAGYRHIDTAQMYGNEAQVGEAIRAFEADRSDIFVPASSTIPITTATTMGPGFIVHLRWSGRRRAR